MFRERLGGWLDGVNGNGTSGLGTSTATIEAMDRTDAQSQAVGLGVGLGIALGAGLGAVWGNVGIGVAIGIVLGAALGLVVPRFKK